jgi:hypothetical protein
MAGIYILCTDKWVCVSVLCKRTWFTSVHTLYEVRFLNFMHFFEYIYSSTGNTNMPVRLWKPLHIV